MLSSLSRSGGRRLSRQRPPLLLIGKRQWPALWPATVSCLSTLAAASETIASSTHQQLKPPPLFKRSLHKGLFIAKIPTRSGMSSKGSSSSMSSSLKPTSEDKGSASMGAAASRSISTDSTDDALADISFRIADQSRYQDILDLLYTNFHTDEPMSKAVNMIDEVGTRNKVLDEFALHGLVQNLSIMAIDPVTDGLLGVSINVEARKEQKEKSLQDVLEEYDDPRFKHIMTVLYYVNEKAGNLHEELESDILFDIKMVTTDKNQRRGGLATDLLRRSVELARNLGFKAVKTEATGLYSRRAFERLGFTVNAEYLYEDYVSPDGEKVFASLANHHRCTTLMTKRLSKYSTIKEVK